MIKVADLNDLDNFLRFLSSEDRSLIRILNTTDGYTISGPEEILSKIDNGNTDFTNLEKIIALYVKTNRDQLATIDATQAEAYRQAEIVARRVIAGEGSTADKAFLKARDVDAKTVNPMTGKPVKDVTEAAKVIVMTAEIWYSVLNTTEVARKQAVAQIRAMEPKDIPRDLNKWLSENFKWLPDNLS